MSASPVPSVAQVVLRVAVVGVETDLERDLLSSDRSTLDFCPLSLSVLCFLKQTLLAGIRCFVIVVL